MNDREKWRESVRDISANGTTWWWWWWWWWYIFPCILHIHEEFNNNSNTNTGCDSIVSDTNEFINFWLQSLATRGARHKSKKPLITILRCPNTHAHARRILWCLRSQFISGGRDPKKSVFSFNGRTSTYRLFKILKFSGPYLLGMKSSTLQPHFLYGALLWQMMIAIFLPCGRKPTPSDYSPGLRNPSRSKPYQSK